jgi:hypothetical protein
MSDHLVFAPSCAECGTTSARLEIVPPGARPARWEQWPPSQQASFERYRPAETWWMLFDGVVAGNGGGDALDAARAAHLTQLLTGPVTFEAVHAAGFYDD